MQNTALRALGAASLALLAGCAAASGGASSSGGASGSADLSALRGPGDEDREAILAVIQRSFDAIAAQGEEGARMWDGILLDRGTFASTARIEGEPTARIRTFAEHLELMRTQPATESYLERLWDPVVLVEGDVAVVWGPYDFWRGGAFSHGGIDAATLLRTEDGWKVASFAYSVVPDFDSPLPPPGE